MKTTVELPDEILRQAKLYAAKRGKTFKEVLEEALDLLLFNGRPERALPAWETLFGAFKDDPEVDAVQAVIEREFSRVDAEDWN